MILTQGFSYLSKALAEVGGKLYIVGGACRDYFWCDDNRNWHSEVRDVDLLLTGLAPQDVPESVWVDAGMRLIPDAHGKSFASWTLVNSLSGERYDLASPRRRLGPGQWETDPTLDVAEDLKWRDFTVNSVAFNQAESRADKIQSYGHPRAALHIRDLEIEMSYPESIIDDPIRIMRAVRFAAEYGAALSPNTRHAIEVDAPRLRKEMPRERVFAELNKALVGKNPDVFFNLLREMDILEFVLPELAALIGQEQNKYHTLDVWDHTMLVVKNTPADLTVRWAALLHDIAKPQTAAPKEDGSGFSFYNHDVEGAEVAVDILTRLKAPNDLIEDVRVLVREHLSPVVGVSPKSLRRLVKRLGEQRVERFLQLKRADLMGGKPAGLVMPEVDNFEEGAEKLRNVVTEEKPVYSLKHLAVNGNDIMGLGLKPGPQVGVILNALHEVVMDDPASNTKGMLLAMAHDMILAERIG